jgi:hypothetical protein
LKPVALHAQHGVAPRLVGVAEKERRQSTPSMIRSVGTSPPPARTSVVNRST